MHGPLDAMVLPESDPLRPLNRRPERNHSTEPGVPGYVWGVLVGFACVAALVLIGAVLVPSLRKNSGGLVAAAPSTEGVANSTDPAVAAALPQASAGANQAVNPANANTNQAGSGAVQPPGGFANTSSVGAGPVAPPVGTAGPSAGATPAGIPGQSAGPPASSAAPVAARGDETLSIETMQRLKDATVYVKVALGPVNWSGSGFVIQVSGDTAVIVTNQHVVGKPKELLQGSFIPGLRGRDRIALMRLQRAMAGQEPQVSVVFKSSDTNEQIVKADVLCGSDDPDLAILRVSGVRNPPQPIEFRQSPQPVETMALYMLGFPFGESLSTNQGNPSITIGKGSVSSIRKDAAGKLTKLQIDGALNPGNSGGPVVDARGNLLGIAVQTIQGTNIGLAIPSSELTGILQGSLGKGYIISHSVNLSAFTYEVMIPVIDPMKKIKSVAVHFVEGASQIDPAKAGQPQLVSVAGSQKLDLPISAQGVASAKLPVASGGVQGRQVTLQFSFVNDQGQTVYLEPQVVALRVMDAPGAVAGGNTTTTTKNGGTTTTTTTKKDGGTTTTTTTETSGNGSTRRVTTTRRSSSGKPKSEFDKSAKSDGNQKGKKETIEKVDKPGKTTIAKGGGAPAGWTNRITAMKGHIPNEEVTGKVDGIEFTLDQASFEKNGSTLKFQMGKVGIFSVVEVEISLFFPKKIAGQKFIVNGNAGIKDGHVGIRTMHDGDKIPRHQFVRDFLMILEFGEFDSELRILPGKIYLCCPDEEKSYLAGTFEAGVSSD